MRVGFLPVPTILFLLCLAAPASAQGRGPAVPPPVAPETLSRDDAGQATVRAVRIPRPITLDGRLDESIYEITPAIDGFIQQEPREGAPATEPTEVWLFYDDRNVYVAARCHDSHPELDVMTEMRRDQNNITQNESFTVVFDTFLDRRNGFFFQTNPLGALRDQAIIDNQLNVSWNTVWNVRTGRFDGGWTLEMVIPFKSLRYPSSGPQTWGINFRRVVRWKNEYSYLTFMPASYGTGQAIGQMGPAGTMVGLETPRNAKNLELKPYGVAASVTDRTAATPYSNDLQSNGGFDFKYGLTRGLIADLTYRTDFAQVEEDQQQVNLTRFNLFFPEKREFFLEGQGIFAFGGVGSGNGTPGDVPVMFFSRQIGLNRGQPTPVLGGGRVTGRSGRYSIGALNIETEDQPSTGAVATNFTAMRIKRDVLRRSNIGMVATHRSVAQNGIGANSLVGADANFFLFTNLTANAYYARTVTDGRSDGSASYRGTMDYASDRYGFNVEHLLVGQGFEPQTGFARRTDFRRNFAELRFTPRPGNRRVIRKFSYVASLDHVTDARSTVLLNRDLRGSFDINFQSSDQFSVDYVRSYERLPRNFTISPGVIVPAGPYEYQNLRTSYSLGQQRYVSGRVSFGRGSLYNGTRTETSYSGRIGIVPQFAVEPTLTLNWVRLPYGDFSAQIVSNRFILTPTPRMMITSLVQMNVSAHTLTSSIRLRWEYLPGSELFVVYSDGRNTLDSGALTGLLNRSLAIKLTRLLRF